MKKNDKVPKTDKSDPDQKTRVLLEEIHHQVKTVTEQYSSIAKQMSELKSDVKDLKNDMAIVKPALERNCKDTVEVKNDLHEVRSELNSVKMIAMSISHEIKDHDKRIKRLKIRFLRRTEKMSNPIFLCYNLLNSQIIIDKSSNRR